ncbi:DNA primase [Patescibacteria group bacterium]|nr:DNA primase [Patescibacteria group bacterium]MBU1896087.1 DNA primase [Patescibacteria group bacterium]
MTDTSEIKNKIDIVDFISEYVQLKPSGINHKACCPFHQEKTPSFMASRDRQSFHCFGCGKGGDIFTFLQDMEGMEFVEALKFLADRAGIQLTHEISKVNTSQKNRIKDINTAAARFFNKFLVQMDSAKDALDYLHERGIADESIEDWQIGYVSNQWDLLTQYLLKKGHSIDDLVSAGLTIKKDNANAMSGKGFYDRFRGRIMFPIWDIHGIVVGFTGRQLVPDDRSGKYVNTPQTLVFDKSNLVFGLNKAKQEIRKKNLIVVVEGQTDVISCHHAGMQNVVASSGTALTEGHIKLLKRYSENMNMAFDSDPAGEAAAKRGIDLAISAGMNVKVIQIPEGCGKDPDECIKKDKKVWFDAVDNAKAVMDWYFERAFFNKNTSDPKEKQAIANQLLPEINLIPYAVEKDYWLKELSGRLGVDTTVLREDLKRFDKNKLETRNVKPENQNKSLKDQEKDRLGLLFENFFVLLLKFPTPNFEFTLNFESALSTSIYFPLYKAIKEAYTLNNSIDINTLRGKLNSEGKENIVDILLMKGELDFSAISPDVAKSEIESTFTEIKKELNRNSRQELQVLIENAERKGDQEELKELLEKFRELN